MSESSAEPGQELSRSDVRLVIGASSAGTVFEWYDFFIYGTLAAMVGKAFFPADNETLQLLLVWAGFAVGFGFRPLGAILFGFLGDRLGRKYTFLVTVALMGVATAGVGMIPSAESIGIAAPLIVLFLRILQGLALGGEYGGAAIYVAEHSPPHRRGAFTSWIQASVFGGFVMSVVVVLACRLSMSSEDFAAWGWRIPFLLSFLLLAISLWMRLKLHESPVFQAMKAAGKTSANPFKESFTYPKNKRRIFVALFGIAAGLTVIFYSAFFSSLTFLRGPLRVDDTVAEIIVGLSGLVGFWFFILAGTWSDKVGRRKPIVLGYIATLVLLFPGFWALESLANPALKSAAQAAPVTISGPACDYDPFANEQATECGQLLSDFTALGLNYTLVEAPELGVTVGDEVLPVAEYAWHDPAERRAQLTGWLTAEGYNLGDVVPPFLNMLGISAVLLMFAALSGATFGSVAALLTEMFPARIRYSSMSIPYHFGTGYFGGFLPLIAGYIVARTGDQFAGLWYTWVIVAVALVTAWWGIASGPPRDFEEQETA
jgi:MFS family permease